MVNIGIFLKEVEDFGDVSKFKKIVIAPGRFNPPHLGHKLMIDKLVKLGKKLDAEPVVLIIDSGKYGPKNPLPGKVRQKYLSKIFPKVRTMISKNPYEAVYDLADKDKAVPVGGVTGADRGDSYKAMVGRIFGDDVKKQYKAEVLHRDPDSNDDVAGASATKARAAALDNDVVKFRALTGLDNAGAVDLMKQLVKGMKE